GPAEVEPAQERADLAAAVLGTLDDAREVPAADGTRGQERLDGAAVEALGQAQGEAAQLPAIAFGLRALLRDDLGHARLRRRVLGGDGAAQQVLDLVGAL